MKPRLFALSLLCACLSMVCCGNKGPLVLPPELEPPAISSFTLGQVGSAISLQWSFPLQMSDGQLPLDLERIGKVFVYYADASVPLDRFAKKADLCAKAGLKELVYLGGRTYLVKISFRIKDLKAKKYRFAVAYEYGRKKAPLSPPLAIDTMIPPKPIRDLSLEQEKKTLVLHWTRPEADESGQPLPQVLGYHVYRSVGSAAGMAPPPRLTTKPVRGEYFEDMDLGAEGEYAYSVSTVLSSQVESDPSLTVKATVRDIYPPEPPQRLVAFSGPDHVLLNWETVTEADFSHYRIYRREGEAGEFDLLADKVLENQYKDKQAKRGHIYYYLVTAIDLRGNESDRPTPVKHDFQ